MAEIDDELLETLKLVPTLLDLIEQYSRDRHNSNGSHVSQWSQCSDTRCASERDIVGKTAWA